MTDANNVNEEMGAEQEEREEMVDENREGEGVEEGQEGEQEEEGGKEEEKVATKPTKKSSDWINSLKKGTIRVFHAIKWALLVILFFVVLAIFASWNMKRNKKYSKEELSNIRSLVLYAAKSAEEAERIAEENPLQALLHANYAVCYVNAAKHMVTEQAIEGMLGTDIQELEQYLTQLQQTLLITVEQQLLQQKSAVKATMIEEQRVKPNEQGKKIVINQAVASAHQPNPTPQVGDAIKRQLPILPSTNKPSVFAS